MSDVPIKSFKEHWSERDWAGPLVGVIHAAFLLSLDALQIGALFGIAAGLHTLLEYLHVEPFSLDRYDFHLKATDIIKNFDYMLLLMFLVALIYRFWKILKAE